MRGAVAALGLVLAGWPFAAVAQTAITPDTAAGRGLGTTVGQAGRTYTIDGGTRAGANLFHSFAGFDLGAGDTAQWTRSAGDGAQIANVVNRVTGGTPSTIAGVLDSTALPNASFYFVNPAGIVFAPGAQVNVPAAAYFSTAAEVRFADGARFATATPGGSTLSMAAPEAFGFVGGQGAIALSGLTQAFAPTTAILSFSGSDVTMTGSQVAARGLDVVAVGDKTTTYRLADPLSAARGGRLSLRGGSALAAVVTDAPGGPLRISAGEIDLERSNIVSDSGGAAHGGDVLLAADRIRLAPDAIVFTSARGAGAGGDLRVAAGDIAVDARGATTTTGFGATASAGGAAGTVSLTADKITLTGEIDDVGVGRAFVGSTVIGAGSGGDVALTAKTLVVDMGQISTFSTGAGNGGNLRIDAANQDLGAALIVTGAVGAGRPGEIRISGETIAISGGEFGARPGTQDTGAFVMTATKSLEAEGGYFSAASASPLSFGSITLRAPTIVMSESFIDMRAAGDGLAGQVLLDAETLLLDRVQITSTSANGPSDTGLIRLRAAGDIVASQGFYAADTNGTGRGGRIEVEGRNVLIDGATITSDSTGFGPGNAGEIAIKADTLTLTNAAFVSSSSNSEGGAGDVTLTARTISLDISSAIHSDTLVAGKAGNVTIKAAMLDLTNGSSITSDALSGTGDAGKVMVEAGRIGLANSYISSSTSSIGRGGSVEITADQIDVDSSVGPSAGYIASESLAAGDAGDVSIRAKSITLRNAGSISSTSYDDGASGDIHLVIDDLTLLRGGSISSLAARQGDGGDISIEAGKISVQSEAGLNSYILSSVFGGGDAGDISLSVRGALLVEGPSSIASDSFAGAGDAGNVMIKADSITLRNGSGISSSTNDLGRAGTMDIQARSLTLESGGIILSASTSKAIGDAGAVRIAADTITVGKDASITTATFGGGSAGEVLITAKVAVFVNGGEVSSSAGVDATGQAGDVAIHAKDLTVSNGGQISTASNNAYKAGSLEITTGQLTVEGLASLISSSNLSDAGGEAGRVSITADGLRIADGAIITTNSTAGPAGDIDISIRRPGLLVLQGGEFRGVIATSSGPGTGGKITISDPLAIISNGGRIQALGEQSGANIALRSRYFIKAADLGDPVEVNGELNIQVSVYDVSSGVVAADISVLDASRVLRGQCPAARSTGAVSQLITRPVGPYAREPLTLGPQAAITGGACS
jgi:filamentous hemagglutinin family protein